MNQSRQISKKMRVAVLAALAAAGYSVANTSAATIQTTTNGFLFPTGGGYYSTSGIESQTNQLFLPTNTAYSITGTNAFVTAGFSASPVGTNNTLIVKNHLNVYNTDASSYNAVQVGQVARSLADYHTPSVNQVWINSNLSNGAPTTLAITGVNGKLSNATDIKVIYGGRLYLNNNADASSLNTNANDNRNQDPIITNGFGFFNTSQGYLQSKSNNRVRNDATVTLQGGMVEVRNSFTVVLNTQPTGTNQAAYADMRVVDENLGTLKVEKGISYVGLYDRTTGNTNNWTIVHPTATLDRQAGGVLVFQGNMLGLRTDASGNPNTNPSIASNQSDLNICNFGLSNSNTAASVGAGFSATTNRSVYVGVIAAGVKLSNAQQTGFLPSLPSGVALSDTAGAVRKLGSVELASGWNNNLTVANTNNYSSGIATYDTSTGSVRALKASETTSSLTTGANVRLTADAVQNTDVTVNSLDLGMTDTNYSGGFTSAPRSLNLSGTGKITVSSGMVYSRYGGFYGTQNNANAGSIANDLAFGSNEGILVLAENSTISGAIEGTGGLTIVSRDRSAPVNITSTASTYTGKTHIGSAKLSVSDARNIGESDGVNLAFAELDLAAANVLDNPAIANEARDVKMELSSVLDLGDVTNTAGDLSIEDGSTIKSTTAGTINVHRFYVNGALQAAGDYTAVSGSTVTNSTIHVYKLADLDGDDSSTDLDIDLLYTKIADASTKGFYDLNNDTFLDQGDVDELVQVQLGTNYGDANLDSVVDINDYLTLLGNWEAVIGTPSWASGDFSGDGVVDINDYLMMLANWEVTGPGPLSAPLSVSAVPEPGTAAVLALSALALLGRRRRA